jgi:uncharacterized protein (DUF433 family)
VRSGRFFNLWIDGSRCRVFNVLGLSGLGSGTSLFVTSFGELTLRKVIEVLSRVEDCCGAAEDGCR